MSPSPSPGISGDRGKSPSSIDFLTDALLFPSVRVFNRICELSKSWQRSSFCVASCKVESVQFSMCIEFFFSHTETEIPLDRDGSMNAEDD